ncbi:S-DNA-T family DNA segregation ATPase FtsK/SpoIIIE, partial [Saccharopolyspora erythraea NRRL 2338]
MIEGEIVEPPQVDQPEPRGTGSALARTEKREPILPSWAKDSQEFADTARWALGYAGHTAGFHAVRCPVYIARIIARVPQGTLRLLRGLARWLTDAEGRPVRNAAARREDATEYLKLSTQRDGRIRSRGPHGRAGGGRHRGVPARPGDAARAGAVVDRGRRDRW